MLLFGLTVGPNARADNGDLLNISEALLGVDLVDVARDPSDGTFWILGASGSTIANHAIYHLDPTLQIILGSIQNPHPMGNIATNDLTTNRGIAFRSLSNTMLIMSSVGPRLDQELSVREISRDGTETLASSFVVQTPAESNANLFGLTYDVAGRNFWSVDAENDEVLQIGLDGAILFSLSIPGKTTAYTTIQGRGISYEFRDLAGRLHLPYGDIFTGGPQKVIEIDTEGTVEAPNTGVRTGRETALREIPEADLRGIEAYTGPLSSRRFVVIGASGTLYEVNRRISDPQPPTELVCNLTLGNQVELRWKNQGTGADRAYNGRIQILRNGTPLTAIDGDATFFADSSPVAGTATYSVRGSEASGGPFSEDGCQCNTTVGPGGLVDWSPFPGSMPTDIVEHPETREIFVSDELDDKIYRFDSDFNLIAEYDSPIPDPSGLAIIPSIFLGFPVPQEFTNVLAVAESRGSRVRLVDSDAPDGPQITTLTLALGDDPRIGGMTFDTSRNEFVVVNRASSPPQIFRLQSNGALVSNCTPAFIPETVDHGAAYFAIQDSFLFSYSSGVIRETFPQGGCTTSQLSLGLGATGFGSEESRFGLAISDNTLLVASLSKRALYRLLIFPFSPDFIRGDVDKNEAVNITDAYAIASYLFLDGAEPVCKDAADVNDDGFLDIGDPVYLLFSLFVANSADIPAPFPEPGNDLTFLDNLGCEG